MSPPEFQLLVNCAREKVDAQAIRALIDQGLDWQAVLEIAERNCVRPMLYRTLKSVYWDGVPCVIQVELERFSKAHILKSLLFTAEFVKLLGLFQEENMEVIGFKGPVLGDLVYGDIT